jgi:O-6-methylguanine DNA methyltransferase
MKFDGKVLALCRKIPRGRVTTYGEIARAMGKPGASRAVGQALKRNPRPVEVPCHRVVRSDGSPGGYGGSGKGNVEKKILLLRKEGITVEKGKIKTGDYIHGFG